MTVEQAKKVAPDVPAFDLSGFTPYRLALAAQLLSEGLAREYRRRFDISIPEWRVLVHLTHAGGASVRDIEAQVMMEKSKVSRAASRLEVRGLISKRVDKTDRRLLHLELTRDGAAVMAELLPLAADFQKQVETALGAGFAAFDRGLQRLIEARNDHTS